MILCSQGVSYSGFLWDSSSGIDLKDASVLDAPVVNGNGHHTYPLLYLAHFIVSNDFMTYKHMDMLRVTGIVSIFHSLQPQIFLLLLLLL